MKVDQLPFKGEHALAHGTSMVIQGHKSWEKKDIFIDVKLMGHV